MYPIIKFERIMDSAKPLGWNSASYYDVSPIFSVSSCERYRIRAGN